MPRFTQRDFVTSLSFNGTSAQVVANYAGLNSFTTTTLSCFCWIKTSTNGDQKIMGNSNAGTSGFLFELNTGVLRLEAFTAGSNKSLTQSFKYYDNVWHLVGFTWDGSNVQFYADGAAVGGTQALTGTLSAGGQPFSLGVAPWTGALYYTGLMDDPIIWTSALSSSDVSNLYYIGIVPTTGLLERWKFDEGSGTTALDSSGNAFNGTITAATYSTDVFMKARAVAGARSVAGTNFGSALKFNGTSSSVTSSTNVSTVNNNFTMACWVNITALSGGNQTIFMNGYDGPGSGRGYYLTITSTGLLQAVYGFVVSANSASTLSINTWYHVAVVRNNGTSQIYVNGIASGSTFGNTPNAPGGTTLLGARLRDDLSTKIEFLNGVIDDARIYDRALDATEILSLYNQNSVSTTSLKLLWMMDEGTGTTTSDSSGNSGTGTLTSTTWSNGIVAPSGNRKAVLVARTVAT